MIHSPSRSVTPQSSTTAAPARVSPEKTHLSPNVAFPDVRLEMNVHLAANVGFSDVRVEMVFPQSLLPTILLFLSGTRPEPFGWTTITLLLTG